MIDVQALLAAHQAQQQLVNARLASRFGEWMDALKLVILEAQNGNPQARSMLVDLKRALSLIESASSGIIVP